MEGLTDTVGVPEAAMAGEGDPDRLPLKDKEGSKVGVREVE